MIETDTHLYGHLIICLVRACSAFFLRTITDPRLARETTRVPRRSDYVKRPVLSATIHPDLKRTLVAMSERTGMSVSQVTDEVLYTGLIEMQEL